MHLMQHQDQSKCSELYRKTGHSLVLEPKDKSEKGLSPKDSAANGDELILQMLWVTSLWRQK